MRVCVIFMAAIPRQYLHEDHVPEAVQVRGRDQRAAGLGSGAALHQRRELRHLLRHQQAGLAHGGQHCLLVRFNGQIRRVLADVCHDAKRNQSNYGSIISKLLSLIFKTKIFPLV